MITFVGVCGGRDFADRVLLDVALRHHVTAADVIVHGDADGADTLAGAWAREHGNHEIPIKALWRWFNKSAGARRNAVIAALPLRLLIALPGGRGTADMVAKARAKKIPVIEVPARSASVAL
jgi:YspA, cpYpsA-related SLOG family